jgi:hypothetical protein
MLDIYNTHSVHGLVKNPGQNVMFPLQKPSQILHFEALSNAIRCYALVPLFLSFFLGHTFRQRLVVPYPHLGRMRRVLLGLLRFGLLNPGTRDPPLGRGPFLGPFRRQHAMGMCRIVRRLLFFIQQDELLS